MSGWRKKLLHFTLRAAQSLVIPVVLVLALCNFLKFTFILCSVPENGLQAFVWRVGASDKRESEGGHRDSNGAHHAEGGHGSAVPCWHCHDRYWQDRWVTETKGVLCRYTVFALFHLGAVYVHYRLCVCACMCAVCVHSLCARVCMHCVCAWVCVCVHACGFKTCIGLCSFPKHYFLC